MKSAQNIATVKYTSSSETQMCSPRTGSFPWQVGQRKINFHYNNSVPLLLFPVLSSFFCSHKKMEVPSEDDTVEVQKNPIGNGRSNFKTLQKLQRPNIRGAHQLINMIPEYQFALMSLGALKSQQFKPCTTFFPIFLTATLDHYSTKPQGSLRFESCSNSGPQL